MKPIAYGVDFGTTNSSIAVAYPDRTEIVPVNTRGVREVMPSIVYWHRDGIFSAGAEAVQQYLVTGSRRTRCGGCPLVQRQGRRTFTNCRQYKPGGGCQDARIATELKSFLADDRFRSTHSWARDFDLPTLVSVVLRDLKRAADLVTGYDVRRAVIGHPVLFVGAEGPNFAARQQLALQRLSDAAIRAGFEEVEFLEEPVAVVVDERLERGLVVALDFGGGTFDVAVVDLSPDQGEVIARQEVSIGGELLTELLFERKVAPELGLDGQVPAIRAELREWLRSLAGVLRVLSDKDAEGLIRDAATRSAAVQKLERILYGGFAYQFYKAVEDAKIALSSVEQTSIEFHRHGVDVSIPVTRREFEGIISEPLRRIFERIHAALDQASVQPGQVDAVLRTGGSSSIPAFVRLLEDLFGPSKVLERPVYTTVVHGLAAHARARWAASSTSAGDWAGTLAGATPGRQVGGMSEHVPTPEEFERGVARAQGAGVFGLIVRFVRQLQLRPGVAETDASTPSKAGPPTASSQREPVAAVAAEPRRLPRRIVFRAGLGPGESNGPR